MTAHFNPATLRRGTVWHIQPELHRASIWLQDNGHIGISLRLSLCNEIDVYSGDIVHCYTERYESGVWVARISAPHPQNMSLQRAKLYVQNKDEWNALRIKRGVPTKRRSAIASDAADVEIVGKTAIVSIPPTFLEEPRS